MNRLIPMILCAALAAPPMPVLAQESGAPADSQPAPVRENAEAPAPSDAADASDEPAAVPAPAPAPVLKPGPALEPAPPAPELVPALELEPADIPEPTSAPESADIPESADAPEPADIPDAAPAPESVPASEPAAAPAAAPASPSAPAPFVESFKVEDIRVEGLRRFDPGVIFQRVKVEIGDTFAPEDATPLIREIYKTGYFRSVGILRDGGVLVVKVSENPTIAEVSFVGVEEFQDSALEQLMERVGIVRARVFSRGVVDQARQAIEQAYVEKNFYRARVEPIISPLERNRVAVEFRVTEGVEASIRSVELVGVEAFYESTLLRDMEMEPRGLLNIFTNAYRYSDAKLQADIERIRTRYLEEGYLRFEVDNSQVVLSSDKRGVDIVIHVKEGGQYTVAGHDFEIDGDSPVSEEEMRELVLLEEGEVYSGQLAGETEGEISRLLGDRGHARAQTSFRADINDEDNTVRVIYKVEPGPLVFVRRIEITGNESTDDKVIRREMLQFEREKYSRDKVERSRDRINRLGYFGGARITERPVPESDNQTDLEVSVTERPLGKISFGAGFSTDGGVSYNGSFAHPNIFGSGNDFSFSLESDDNEIKGETAIDELYHTDDGVSRHFSFSYGETTSGDDVANYSIDGFETEYGYGVPFTDESLYSLRLVHNNILVDSSTQAYPEFTAKYGSSARLSALLLKSGLTYDSRDGTVAPTRGQRISATGRVVLPVLDLRYYSFSYLHEYYKRILRRPVDIVGKLRGGFGIGGAYGDDVYPSYERFTVGGTSTIRGFSSNSIGESVEGGLARGGQTRFYGTAELSVDSQLFETQKIFLVPFVDVGAAGSSIRDYGSIRASWGMELRWVSPLGPLRFTYTSLLRRKPTDHDQPFQFAVSTF